MVCLYYHWKQVGDSASIVPLKRKRAAARSHPGLRPRRRKSASLPNSGTNSSRPLLAWTFSNCSQPWHRAEVFGGAASPKLSKRTTDGVLKAVDLPGVTRAPRCMLDLHGLGANAMNDFHEGGCLCRDIKYRAHGLPLEAIVCHCGFCQRRTGTAFGIAVYFPANRVEFTGSTATSYEHRSEEHGRWLRLAFCPRCGTTIGVTAERRPGQQGLMGGTFDDRTWFTISRHIWTTSKLLWVELPAGVPSSSFGSSYSKYELRCVRWLKAWSLRQRRLCRR
jgi:hypothetical protein